nr:dystrophin-like [Leptinotarsa decemlineata]
MTTSWRKVEDKNGFAYYFNEASNCKQWDHPKFVEIRQRLDDCNYVKYSMYRVALKFRVLQNALHMEELPLTTIAGVFEKHRLGANESSLCLESCDLEAVLSDIYFASNKINHTNIDIDFATELMLNFLYNIFDEHRGGTIQVSSTKVALSILSSCSMKELYSFIFGLCADHNNCVTRLRLQAFLSKIVEITTFLHEDGSYGSHLVNSAMENCFKNSPGLVGINESMFVKWLESSPKILSWIPLLHRIKIAEPVLHSVKCTTCKTNPLMGLRYKCIKCLRYTQCQRCFFTGRTSHSHKLSHSMREYCSSSSDHSYTVMKKFCRLLNCSKQTTSIIVDPKPLCDQNRLVTSDSKEVLCNVEPLSTPQTQLQLIIKQLEMQNKELHQILLLGNRNDKEMRRYLEEHRIHVAAQIQKLKSLKDYFAKPGPTSINPRNSPRKKALESTPMLQSTYRMDRIGREGLELFSPIVSIPESPRKVKNTDNFDEKVSNSSENTARNDTSVDYCIDDMSTWIGGKHKMCSLHISFLFYCISR